MQGTQLYEYAVIRVVPRIERQEFINVGLILYCSSKRFLQTIYSVDEKRLCALSSNINVAEVEERLEAFEKICSGNSNGGTIGSLPIASRFRWLTSARSTIVQTSPVHPGLCIDPHQTLLNLFSQLVL